MTEGQVNELFNVIAKYCPRSPWIPADGEEPDFPVKAAVRKLKRLDYEQGEAVVNRALMTNKANVTMSLAHLHSCIDPVLQAQDAAARERASDKRRPDHADHRDYVAERRALRQQAPEVERRLADLYPDENEREAAIEAASRGAHGEGRVRQYRQAKAGRGMLEPALVVLIERARAVGLFPAEATP